MGAFSDTVIVWLPTENCGVDRSLYTLMVTPTDVIFSGLLLSLAKIVA